MAGQTCENKAVVCALQDPSQQKSLQFRNMYAKAKMLHFVRKIESGSIFYNLILPISWLQRRFNQATKNGTLSISNNLNKRK